MSFFSFGNKAPEQDPATDLITKDVEGEVMGEENTPTDIYLNNHEVLSEEEAREIVDNKKDEGWREQP